MKHEDILAHNQRAWDREAKAGSPWTTPVADEVIEAAQQGRWSIILTPHKSVPRAWFPTDLTGVRLLALAGSGGQQAPILAAAGAQVTVLDLSPQQLAHDKQVAKRFDLPLRIEQGDMADLSRFDEESFDLIINPCSNCFVPDVERVFRECARVLRPGGRLMVGMLQPTFYMFDHDDAEGSLTVKHQLPYRGDALEHRSRYEESGAAFEYSHTLTSQIGGQLNAGLRLLDIYEDRWPASQIPLDAYAPLYFATLSERA